MSGGQEFHMSIHNGTSWTDYTDRRPMIGCIFDQFDDGKSSRTTMSIGV